MPDASPLGVEQEHRASHSFGLALDQPDDRVESFGEGSAERDKLEDRALSRVERR
jgi:hypothetical protein